MSESAGGTSAAIGGPGYLAGIARADPADNPEGIKDLFREHHLELVRMARPGRATAPLPSCGGSHYRLLNVTGTGGNLLAGPEIASPAAQSAGYIPAALVTADGSAVITTRVRNVRGASGSFIAFGRVDGSGFAPLAGFPAPSSGGISGQQAAAW